MNEIRSFNLIWKNHMDGPNPVSMTSKYSVFLLFLYLAEFGMLLDNNSFILSTAATLYFVQLEKFSFYFSIDEKLKFHT
jgi:hypothetical protein